ncbi:MAG: hypothetical protein ACKVSF_11160 [Alphaproteobacteria bacterium]
MNDAASPSAANPARAAPTATGNHARPTENGALSEGHAWTEGLAPELRALAANKGWRGPADAVRSYGHLEQSFGADKIAVPGRNARPEDWSALYDRLGRPPSPEQYDLSAFHRPEAMPWSGETEKAMLAEMHGAGLNNDQATRLLAKYAQVQEGAWRHVEAARTAAREDSVAMLRSEWGPRYDAQLDLAKRAFRAAFGEQSADALALKTADGTELGDHPAIIRAFARLGAMLAEDELVGPTGARLAHSTEDAKAEIARMHGDARQLAVLMDKSHPEYETLVARRNDLFAIAYPD